MNEFTTVGCIVVAILCIVHMVRPVGRAEKASLLLIAEGDSKSEEIADRLVARKWLTWAEFDHAEKGIKRVKAKQENDHMLAESAARKVVRDAQRKV